MLFEVNIHSVRQFRPTKIPLVLIITHNIVPAHVELIFSNVYYMLILQKSCISLLLLRYFRYNQKKTLNAHKHRFLSIPSDKIGFFYISLVEYLFRFLFWSFQIQLSLILSREPLPSQTLYFFYRDTFYRFSVRQ